MGCSSCDSKYEDACHYGEHSCPHDECWFCHCERCDSCGDIAEELYSHNDEELCEECRKGRIQGGQDITGPDEDHHPEGYWG